jgi:hypothetical protein
MESSLRLEVIEVGPVVAMPQRQSSAYPSGEDLQFFIGPRHSPRRVESTLFD